MNESYLRQRLALALTSGISPKTYYDILAHYPDLDLFFKRIPEPLQKVDINWREAELTLKWMQSEPNHVVLAHDDALYPALLKEISVPPPFIFTMGQQSVLQKTHVAIVGSRKATPNGLECAYDIAEGLAAAGFVVVSGMARGIDTRAHEGAMLHNETIAVFGTGIDVTYPKSNQQLRERIIEQGVLVSEFPLRTAPMAQHFPRRNRIISGISHGVIVIEAQEKSGSLITARYALEQNREVMALPGMAGDPKHCGCHRLIKQGAHLVESADDVLEVLGVSKQISEPTATKSSQKRKNKTESIPEMYQKVLDAVDFKLTSIDLIQKRANLDIKYCLTALSELAWLNLVEQVDGGFVKRKDF